MPVYERIPYVELTAQERASLHDWCTLHDIDYTRVPIEARIERDPETGDWLVEAFGNTSADRVTVRRPFKAELAWPARAGHPMVCGATSPAIFPGARQMIGSAHEHVCHEPAQRPDQTAGVPQHRCATCGCTWITVTRDAGYAT